MSYHIYTTEGIILKRSTFGEANILLHILTRDLGLIIASAQSARVAHSKLRPALQELSWVVLSAVKGKRGWKVTNVASKESFYFGYPEHTHKIIFRVASVLLQMMPGEDPHPEVFEIIVSGCVALKDLPADIVSEFECLIMLRVLYQLGYVARDGETEEFLVSGEWGSEVLDRAKLQRKILVARINSALKASQL